ncbi:MAG TPA: methyltransferase domain-containing protein, partial [Longimicrobium sp.]|nr:methyltransferase domain-containing protein [Longimicrobium sp.]
MIRYSKPLGELLAFKQHFFHENDAQLLHFKHIARVYRAQPPRTSCKNCTHPLDFSPSASFIKLGVEYTLCARCGHCNGAFEDTDAFCRFLYTDDDGHTYAKSYTADDVEQYRSRVENIYLPKARFLKAALAEAGAASTELVDFGAGAGYFVAAARECGFEVAGYDPSAALVQLGNAMMGEDLLVKHDMEETAAMVAGCRAPITSFVGVLEHLSNPRDVLQALKENHRVEYVFFSVPLFSP